MDEQNPERRFDDLPSVRPAPDTVEFLPDVLPVLPAAGEPSPAVLPIPAEAEKSYAALVISIVLAVIGYSVLLAIPGETRYFASVSLQILPFVGLALLAYTATMYDAGRLITILYWLFLVGLVGAMCVGLTFILVMDPAKFKALLAGAQPGGDLFLPHGPRVFGLATLGIVLTGLASLLAFLPPVRRAFAAVTPLDPKSFVHATALATVLALTAFLLIPLIAVAEPPMLKVLVLMKDDPAMKQLADRDLRIDQVYAFVWMVPAALVAVGFPLTRNFRQTLERVGLVRPEVWQISFAIGGTFVFLAFMTLVNILITDTWKLMNWPTTSEDEFGQFMHSAINPVGALVIGFTAGLGEELIFRGVLQPRVGILLANLLFTVVHALQYNFDALTSVFTIGLILGVVRARTNVTTAAIIHGLYDFVLILMAFYKISPEEHVRRWMGL